MISQNRLPDVILEQSSNHKTKVIIDGLEIRGLTEVEYRNSIDGRSEMSITFYTGTVNSVNRDISDVIADGIKSAVASGGII